VTIPLENENMLDQRALLESGINGGLGGNGRNTARIYSAFITNYLLTLAASYLASQLSEVILTVLRPYMSFHCVRMIPMYVPFQASSFISNRLTLNLQ
jgi:hypothetical protein